MSTSATADVQRIVDFVNTRDVDDELEHLPDTDSLKSWLVEHELASHELVVSPGDIERAHQIREALRVVLLAHHGAAIDPAEAELAAANQVLLSVPLHLHFTGDGGLTFHAPGDSVDAALGRMLARIPAAAANGVWQRAKVCPEDTCQWAFYDQSRNRSRRWCSMEVCGNREKSRAFRARNTPTD